MSRKTLITPQTRRCSGVVVAAATAALILAPGAAFAAGQPAGPGEPGSSHSAESSHPAGTSHSAGAGHAGSPKGGRPGHTTGHGAGHSSRSGGHSNTGHSTTGHSGSGHSGSGHSASHTAGHAGRGHTAGHSTGHTTSHPVSHSAASHKTGPASEANASGVPRTSGASGGSGGSASDNMQNPEQGLVDTVTKVSVSSTRADDGSLTMTARVSPAHRTPGDSPATGTVKFFLDGASSGPVPLANGRASVQIDLGPGEHTAGAQYSGDAEHAPSDSGPVSVSGD